MLRKTYVSSFFTELLDNFKFCPTSLINFHVLISDFATEVICTEKANGEAAHISARYIGNKFYLIVGSKNVHLMLGKF